VANPGPDQRRAPRVGAARRAAAGADVARRARGVLVATAAATVLLYLFGGPLAYPLIYLSTLAHELGHGITALLVGGRFERFEMWSDASGLAHVQAYAGWQHALIAAGGLVGPAAAAAGGFVLARRPGAARVGLGAIALVLGWVVVSKVRTPFGIAVAGVLAVTAAVVALRASGPWAQRVLAFASVQLALSVFSRSDYLFAGSARVDGAVRRSDAAAIAELLGGPLWLWGAACGAISVVVLVAGGWVMLRGVRSSAHRGDRQRLVAA
jgi:hypothetical protein